MVPREVAMTLAKLENEKIWLQELILNEVQEARNRIYAKYAPQMSAIQEAIDQHKTLIAGHVSLTEELHWRFHDRQSHNTTADTTAKMKRSQRQEKKRRTLYAVKNNEQFENTKEKRR